MLLLKFTQYEMNTAHFLRLSRVKRSSINKDYLTLAGCYANTLSAEQKY